MKPYFQYKKLIIHFLYLQIVCIYLCKIICIDLVKIHMNSQTQLVEKSDKNKLTENVQKWVFIEGKLKEVNEKTKKMREMKTQLGKEICNYMTDNNLNSHIEISDGELRFFEKKEYTTLSFGYVEKCLQEIIADDNQVKFIIKYLKDNRETTTSLDIKRHYNK